ncbi:MAG: GGDEF domain-containing protein [Alphaproteobacteria bacterium]|nr:GGDEF domain-containing protein [Alphaproteobacteria bacterium]
MDRYEHAQALAKTAIGLMAERAVAPTPENYELFFGYVSSQNPALSRVMGDLIASRKPITPQLLEDLRKRFFPRMKLEDEMVSLGNNVSEALGSMLAKLEQAGKDTEDYGRKLSEVSGELGSTPSAGGMRRIVEGLRSATSAMEARTHALESELQKSSHEVDELRRKLEDVRKESLTDPLTGIANRKAFDADLHKALLQAREHGEPLSLLMCDIDRFKQFNDTFGHQTGDQVLRLVANCLNENVKGRDTAARYGGEEFAVIVRGAALGAASLLADQIRQVVQAKKLVKKSTGDVLGTITISIGAAQLQPGEDEASLIHRADAGLYAAKAAGRNCVRSVTSAQPSDVAA